MSTFAYQSKSVLIFLQNSRIIDKIILPLQKTKTVVFFVFFVLLFCFCFLFRFTEYWSWCNIEFYPDWLSSDSETKKLQSKFLNKYNDKDTRQENDNENFENFRQWSLKALPSLYKLESKNDFLKNLIWKYIQYL